VTLARALAAQGAKVAFLDGANLLKVRMYEGAAETWREWGRSLDLKDAASPGQVWGDWLLLLAVQGLPIPIVLLLLSDVISGGSAPVVLAAFSLNLLLVLIRVGLTFAISPSCDRTHASSAWLFWLSPLADPIAVLRLFLSSVQTPTQWRGRSYGKG
jgi:dolichol-phosphate mannosyltransferase